MTEDQPDPTRVVADADVLAADLLIGQDAREALDLLRDHSWLALIATSTILTDAEAVIAQLTDTALAEDWRARIEAEAEIVEPTLHGHPALVAAAASDAATVLSFHEQLQSVQAGASIRPHLATSVKSPHAFARLLDPASLYETLYDDAYPGPDRDPAP